MTQTAVSTQYVNIGVKQVYLAFTRSILLRQWLCDFATVLPRPGGRMYLWWNGDFFSAGEYIALQEDKQIKFSWHAKSEPAPSEVTVDLLAQGTGTLVTLTHSVSDGKEWASRAEGFKTEWDSTLPNLASILEKGIDLRIYNRPMLGIQISDFNAEIARANGIPVNEGLRLEDASEGMGAYAAGLRKGDVIVEFDGKMINNDFGSLASALQGKKGGDKVQVRFYRGGKDQTVMMELTKRPHPDVPWEPQILAKMVQEKYAQAITMLENAFSGSTEAETEHAPAAGEWSAKQTLAHLIHTERNWLSNIDDTVGGFERIADDWGGNISAHIDATGYIIGDIRGMMEAYKLLTAEVVSFLSFLPADFVSRKCDYLNVANTMLNGMLPHTVSHIEQIKNALAHAKL
jgi:uncharacterized protein YndB with AHSA1/START domain